MTISSMKLAQSKVTVSPKKLKRVWISLQVAAMKNTRTDNTNLYKAAKCSLPIIFLTLRKLLFAKKTRGSKFSTQNSDKRSFHPELINAREPT